jgi:hypothetical protein
LKTSIRKRAIKLGSPFPSDRDARKKAVIVNHVPPLVLMDLPAAAR